MKNYSPTVSFSDFDHGDFCGDGDDQEDELVPLPYWHIKHGGVKRGGQV